MDFTNCSFRPRRWMSRRDVLRTALLSAGIVALGPFDRRGSVALGAPKQSFKRLVVINLIGGCDTLHAVIPTGLSQYYASRGVIAVPQASALPLNGTSLYRLHPAMPRIQGLWNTGDAACVQRVGYPTENLSHFESSDIYSYGVRNGFGGLRINKSGWVARYADLQATSPLGAVSLGLGRPLDFVGGVTHGLSVQSLAGFQLVGAGIDGARIEATKSIIHNAPAIGLTYDAQQALADAYDLSDQVQHALLDHNAYAATSGVNWPNSAIAGHLKDAAALIYGGFDTRLFYTGFGGFDTHVGQGSTSTAGGTLGSLLSQLDAAVGAFSDEMKLLGVWDDVVIVVITEFGRRSYTNGSGTDHGHGFCELVLGGAVNGGASYGPDLVNSDLSNATGYLAYAVDFRSVYKEILRDHLGVDPLLVFPEPMPIDTDLGLV